MRREECRVSSEGREVEAFFQVENGRCVATSLTYPPVTDSGLLYLVPVSHTGWICLPSRFAMPPG